MFEVTGRQKVFDSSAVISSASCEGDSVQLDLDLLRRVVGVKQDVDSGQLADGAVNRVGLVGQLDGDGNIRNRGEFHGAGGIVDSAFQAGGRSRGLRRRISLVIDHLHRAVQFLLGDEQGGIDGQSFLELGHGFVQLSVIAQFLAVVDDGRRGLKPKPLEGGPVAQVLRLQVVALLEKAVGGLVLLPSFGVLTFGVEFLDLVGGDGGER